MKSRIGAVIVGLLLLACSDVFGQGPQSSKSKKPYQSSPRLGAPLPHSDDPADPWTIEELKTVEVDVAAGQLQQIASFALPEKAREAVIEGEIEQSTKNLDLFVITANEAEQMQRDPKYELKQAEHIGGALGFFFPVKPGTGYTVWARNEETNRSAHIKLKLKRHFR